jgi:hypothetical protein
MILILIFFKKKISQLNVAIMILNDIMQKKSLFWSHEN